MRDLNPLVADVPPALSIYLNEVVYRLKRTGKDILVLSLGEAYFDIPEFSFSEIDFVRGYHYSESQGIPELRAKLSNYYQERYGISVSPQDFLVTAGSKAAIYLTILATASPGSTVLIKEPAWLSYVEHVKLTGATPIMVPHDVSLSELMQYADDTTVLAIVCNPNNPAGTVESEDDVRKLVDHAASAEVRLLFDEAYSEFLPKGDFHSAIAYDDARGVVSVASSLSKNMGISGWLLGYVIAAEPLRSAILNLNQHIITCAPTILQLYVTQNFDALLEATLPQVQQVTQKRQLVRDQLAGIGLTAMPGDATFYLFVSLADSPNSDLVIALWLLLTQGVAVVPGSAYGDSTGRFVRVSVGTEPVERIVEGLTKLAAAIATSVDLRAEAEAAAAEQSVALPAGWPG